MNVSLIKSHDQCQAYLARLKQLFHAEEGSPEADELEVLALVIGKYEDEHYPMEAPDPIEAIRFMMEQRGMDAADLGALLNSRSRASELLNRKRKLSINHIRKLHLFLGIPSDVLIQDYELSP